MQASGNTFFLRTPFLWNTFGGCFWFDADFKDCDCDFLSQRDRVPAKRNNQCQWLQFSNVFLKNIFKILLSRRSKYSKGWKILLFILLYLFYFFNPLSANPTKWSNTLKQFVGKLPTNCLSGFDHFVGLALKGLKRLVF